MQIDQLSAIRRPLRLRGVAGVIALAAFLPLGAGCRSDAPASRSVSADTWAVVDGRPITRERVEKTFRSAQDPAQTLSQAEALTLKLSLLNEMIVQDILLAKAQELKIEVPQNELDAAFNERKQNLSDEAFQAELKKRNLTPDDMRDALRREMLANKVIEQEVTSKITVTDEEVAEFFNANRDQFTVKEESYRIAQIVITPQREPQQANRTGNDATTPEEAAFKVRMVMERLKAGAPFADVAMDYSEDPESAQRGGDLGLVPVSRLKGSPPQLRDAVIGQQPGTVRVVSAGGAHTIVAVIAHEQAGERGLTTPGVKEGITETLEARKEQLLRTAYLTNARSEAEVENHLARRLVETQGKM